MKEIMLLNTRLFRFGYILKLLYLNKASWKFMSCDFMAAMFHVKHYFVDFFDLKIRRF